MSITLRDVTVAYDDKLVLDRFSLTLPDTGVFVLFGPSGSGKTTLLDVISGLLRPTTGAIEGLEGRSIARVFQDNRLIPGVNARENVACVVGRASLARIADDGVLIEELFERSAPKSPERVAAAALSVTGLGDEADALPDELSGGMQKRLGLARALAADGALVILDEPTAGLDNAAELTLFDRLMRLWREKLVLLVTHERPIAERYATQIQELSGPPLTLQNP